MPETCPRSLRRNDEQNEPFRMDRSRTRTAASLVMWCFRSVAAGFTVANCLRAQGLDFHNEQWYGIPHQTQSGWSAIAMRYCQELWIKVIKRRPFPSSSLIVLPFVPLTVHP
jgi:hypothetical protein